MYRDRTVGGERRQKTGFRNSGGESLPPEMNWPISNSSLLNSTWLPRRLSLSQIGWACFPSRLYFVLILFRRINWELVLRQQGAISQFQDKIQLRLRVEIIVEVFLELSRLRHLDALLLVFL